MFGMKNSGNTGAAQAEKLPGPKETPTLVQNYLVNTMKLDSDLARVLRSVTRQKNSSDPKSKSCYIRIFDEGDTTANKIQVKNYLTLDEHSRLIIFEGWYDEATKTVELEEKNRLSQETTIYTESEILQKIESLNEPGSSVYFYLARGSESGGPLGHGAAIIQLTPQVDGKKVKKYTIYTADVIDMKPVNQGGKLFDTDNVKEIAGWVKQAHHKRTY